MLCMNILFCGDADLRWSGVPERVKFGPIDVIVVCRSVSKVSSHWCRQNFVQWGARTEAPRLRRQRRQLREEWGGGAPSPNQLAS